MENEIKIVFTRAEALALYSLLQNMPVIADKDLYQAYRKINDSTNPYMKDKGR